MFLKKIHKCSLGNYYRSNTIFCDRLILVLPASKQFDKYRLSIFNFASQYPIYELSFLQRSWTEKTQEVVFKGPKSTLDLMEEDLKTF